MHSSGWECTVWPAFLSQSRRLPLLQVVSNNKSFSVGVQSPTEINAPRGCAAILHRISVLLAYRNFLNWKFRTIQLWQQILPIWNAKHRQNPVAENSISEQQRICQLRWPESRAKSHGRSTWKKCRMGNQRNSPIPWCKCRQNMVWYKVRDFEPTELWEDKAVTGTG